MQTNKTANQVLKLFIAVPCYQNLEVVTALSLDETKQWLRCEGILFQESYLKGDSFLPRARSQLATQFMCSDCTHMFCCDADMGFAPEQLRRLLLKRTAVAAGIAPKKQTDESYAVQFLPGDVQVSQDGFASIKACGVAFMVIARRVFIKLAAAFPELHFEYMESTGEPRHDAFQYDLFGSAIIDGVYVEGDHAFCHRWRSIGGTIDADMKSRIDHVGTMLFHGDLESYLQRNGALYSPDVAGDKKFSGVD